jgi:hypothetical protein
MLKCVQPLSDPFFSLSVTAVDSVEYAVEIRMHGLGECESAEAVSAGHSLLLCSMCFHSASKSPIPLIFSAELSPLFTALLPPSYHTWSL